MNHEQNDLEKAFQHVDHNPRPAAKRSAISAGMAAFDEAQEKDSVGHQGKVFWWRLIRMNDSAKRNPAMKRPMTPWAFGSFATAAVVMVAAVLIWQTPPKVVDTPFEEAANIPVTEVAPQISATDTEAPLEESVTLTENTPAQSVEKTEKFVISGDEADRASQPKPKKAIHESKPSTPLKDQAIKRSPPGSTVLLSLSQGDSAEQRSFIYPGPVVRPPPRDILPRPTPDASRERFEDHDTNPVKLVSEEPVSTFSVDVDTASYSFTRRKLNQGVLPQADAVRAEEFLNYFDYGYPGPESQNQPFATHVLVGDSPWKKGNKLLHIGIKGYTLDKQPKSNLVFLLDTSGSMSSQDKLPLVKQSLALLLDQLRPDDTVAIAVYAGSAGTVLEPTPVKEKQKILSAMNRLKAGGSTAGAEGIQLAYELAEMNFDKDAVNRILIATDGDFNVGISDPNQLRTFVERKREQGIFLSVLGFGQGNYYDEMMQKLAQNGNGVAVYIDTLSEAQKVLVNEATSALFPIAKDVKIQVEFNPAMVAEYRLIGYETRQLKREDFNNDKVDAGDIGAGHTVTAIYEITPVGADSRLIDDSRYDKKPQATTGTQNEYAFLRLRYKLPNEDSSQLIEQPIPAENSGELRNTHSWQSETFRFSASVAGFAQLLKNDQYLANWTYDDAIELALGSRGDDIYGYRNEFVQLIRKAKIAKKM